MEDASKALIMAGSVLMAVLVISLLVFMFGRISSVKQTEADIDQINKIIEFSKKFEQFNKTIYGSELLSLANLYEDYNLTKAEEKGYTPIEIKITIKTQIVEDGKIYVSAGSNKNITEIMEGIIEKNNNITTNSSLESDIEYYETKLYKGRTIKQLSQLSNREIATILGVTYHSDDTDYDVGDMLLLNSKSKDIMEKIETYRNIKTTYTQFKNTRFRCTKVEYDQDGRLNYMNFVEI